MSCFVGQSRQTYCHQSQCNQQSPKAIPQWPPSNRGLQPVHSVGSRGVLVPHIRERALFYQGRLAHTLPVSADGEGRRRLGFASSRCSQTLLECATAERHARGERRVIAHMRDHAPDSTNALQFRNRRYSSTDQVRIAACRVCSERNFPTCTGGLEWSLLDENPSARSLANGYNCLARRRMGVH